MKLIIATKNDNKIREIENIFSGIGDIALLSLKSFSDAPNIEETGDSFEENSFIKAKAISEFTGLAAMADDSGLEVEALGMRPGVLSARYGGESISDQERNILLLNELKSVPYERRKARFVCVITVFFPDGRHFNSRGERSGVISLVPSGDFGFGYDPIFYLPEYRKTMAEITMEEKNRISHRAAAIKKAAEILKSYL